MLARNEGGFIVKVIIPVYIKEKSPAAPAADKHRS